MFKPEDLFDLSQTEHGSIFADCRHAWEALGRIADYLKTNLKAGLHNQCDGVAWVGENVSIGEGTVLEDGVMIKKILIVLVVSLFVFHAQVDQPSEICRHLHPLFLNNNHAL